MEGTPFDALVRPEPSVYKDWCVSCRVYAIHATSVTPMPGGSIVCIQCKRVTVFKKER